MKTVRIIGRWFLIVLICVCLIAYWADISEYVPQRLQDAGDKIKALAGSVWQHCKNVFERDIQRLIDFYERVVS